MSLKILKVVLDNPDRVALEYEVVEPVDAQGYQPHHPQTFPSETADDTCTWENLRLALPPGATDEDCILLARALLERKVKEDAEAGSEREDEMMTLLNEGFK